MQQQSTPLLPILQLCLMNTNEKYEPLSVILSSISVLPPKYSSTSEIVSGLLQFKFLTQMQQHCSELQPTSHLVLRLWRGGIYENSPGLMYLDWKQYYQRLIAATTLSEHKLDALVPAVIESLVIPLMERNGNGG